MRGLLIAPMALVAAAAFALPMGASAQVKGCTSDNGVACEATRKESLADKQFGAKADGMNSYVRKNSRDDDKKERLGVEGQINEAIMAGRCDDAIKIAKDNGYHAAVSQIRRSCKS